MNFLSCQACLLAKSPLPCELRFLASSIRFASKQASKQGGSRSLCFLWPGFLIHRDRPNCSFKDV